MAGLKSAWADPVRQLNEEVGCSITRALSPATSAEIIPIKRSQR